VDSAAQTAVAGVIAAVAHGDIDHLRMALHPYLHWNEPGVRVRGRVNVLAQLADRRSLVAPDVVELREGQIYRWTRHGGAESPDPPG